MTMNITKAIFMVAITMAITIAITMHTTITHNASSSTVDRDLDKSKVISQPSKRLSRFLAQNDVVHARNPRAADHCHKDYEVCQLEEYFGANSTCCNNKCVDLTVDKHNCGACKFKCKYTDSCCRGECVNLYYDKRHCGRCNKRCLPGQYCIFGMCDYA